MEKEELARAFEQFQEDVNDLVVPNRVPVLHKAPGAVSFLREYVSANRPCVIKGLASQWKATQAWTSEYLRRAVGDIEVSVEVTPNGRADAIVEDERLGRVFALPHTERMPFARYLTSPEPVPGGVAYVSHQNSSMTEADEFRGMLMSDIDTSVLGFAEEAFGCAPDAVNFWMGPKEAVTSLHKDHYENMYAVVAGKKRFTLYHPSVLPYLYETRCRTAQWVPRGKQSMEAMGTGARQQGNGGKGKAAQSGQEKQQQEGEKRAGEEEQGGVAGGSASMPASFALQMLETADAHVAERPWIAADPNRPNFAAHPLFRRAKSLVVEVEAGDVLYLPAMWFHQVEQEGAPHTCGQCVAVNFWYDMQFDARYCYASLVESLAPHIQRACSAQHRENGEDEEHQQEGPQP